MHICICDYLLDIVQNSYEAGSSLVELGLEESERQFSCRIQDNGKGMDALVQARVLDPFFTDGIKHAKRKVGLGLPFLSQACEACDGKFALQSEAGKGTLVECSFNLENLDAPPLGDLVTTLVALMSHPLATELIVKRSLNTSRGSGSYILSKTELEEVLGKLETSGVLNLLRQYISSQEEDLCQFYVEPKLAPLQDRTSLHTTGDANHG